MSASQPSAGSKRARAGSSVSDSSGPGARRAESSNASNALAAGLRAGPLPTSRPRAGSGHDSMVVRMVKTLVQRELLPVSMEHHMIEQAMHTPAATLALQSALAGDVSALQRLLAASSTQMLDDRAVASAQAARSHTQLAQHLIQGMHKDMLQEGTPNMSAMGGHVLPPALDTHGAGTAHTPGASTDGSGPRGSPTWSVPQSRTDRLASLGSVSELLSGGGASTAGAGTSTALGMLGPNALAGVTPGVVGSTAARGTSAPGRTRLDSIASVASSLASGGELPMLGGRSRGLSMFDSGTVPTSEENATALALLTMPRAGTPESRAPRGRHDSISMELAHVPQRASFDSAYDGFTSGRGEGLPGWTPGSGPGHAGAAQAGDGALPGRTRRTASNASSTWLSGGMADSRSRLGSMASAGFGEEFGAQSRDRRFSVTAGAQGMWSGLDALSNNPAAGVPVNLPAQTASSGPAGSGAHFSYSHERASPTEVQQRVQQRMSGDVPDAGVSTRSSRTRAPTRAAMYGAASGPGTRFHTAVPSASPSPPPPQLSQPQAQRQTTGFGIPRRVAHSSSGADSGRRSSSTAAAKSRATHSVHRAAPVPGMPSSVPEMEGDLSAGHDEGGGSGSRRASTRTRAAAAAARAVSAAAAAVDAEDEAYDYEYDFNMKTKRPKNWSKVAATRRREGWVGVYSPAQRRKRLERWHAKRQSRVWTKKVKYGVRKNFADSRLRVKGRFVKKEDEAALRDWIQMM